MNIYMAVYSFDRYGFELIGIFTNFYMAKVACDECTDGEEAIVFSVELNKVQDRFSYKEIYRRVEQ